MALRVFPWPAPELTKKSVSHKGYYSWRDLFDPAGRQLEAIPLEAKVRIRDCD